MLRYSIIRRHYNEGLKSVAHLVEHLEKQIEDLTLTQKSQLHISHLKSTVIAQRDEIKRLSQTIENKSVQLVEAQQLNHQLQKRIRELEKCLEAEINPSTKIDSQNSSLPPSLDLPWQKPKRTRSLRKKSKLKVGGQFGHKGSTLQQVSNPNRTIVHSVEICCHCGFSLFSVKLKSFQKRQIFEIENGSLTVIEHRTETKSCPNCHQVSKAAFPVNIKAPVQYGASVFSRLLYLHLYQLLPVARTAETMKDLFECPVSWATVQRAAHFCSDKLIRSEQKIKAAIRDSSVVGADETGIRINGENNWVHVARTDSLTHLSAHPKRGKTAIEEVGIINRFKGTLVRDGWFSYNWYQQCQHSLCNAHLLRDLTFVGEAYPNNKSWTDAFAKLLIEIKETVEIANTKLSNSLEDYLQTNFLNRYDVILADAEQTIRGSPEVKTNQLSALSLHKRLVKNKTEILRFMFNFSVPFDNNGSERDLRMLKLQQKISGCFRTINGVKVFCRIRSYLSSVKKQRRSLLTAIDLAFNGKPISVTSF